MPWPSCSATLRPLAKARQNQHHNPDSQESILSNRLAPFCSASLAPYSAPFTLEIYDRVGGGDGFASGVAYGFMEGKGPQAAVEYGAAHGALAMTTPGDTSMVRVDEVEAAMKGKGARVIR